MVVLIGGDMIQSQVNILEVNSSTTSIAANLVCTNCSGLTVFDISMKIYRKGTNFACGGSAPSATTIYPNCTTPYPPCANTYAPNADPPVTYFLTYPAYSLVGNLVTFALDSHIYTACPGRYVGDIYINSNICSSLEFNLADECQLSNWTAVQASTAYENNLQP
jgi:hypothetical protein